MVSYSPTETLGEPKIAAADLVDEVLGGAHYAAVAHQHDRIEAFMTRIKEVQTGLDPQTRPADVTRYVFDSPRVGAYLEVVAGGREFANARVVSNFVSTLGPIYGRLLDDAVAIGAPSYRAGALDEVNARRLGVISGDINDLTSGAGTSTGWLENLNGVVRAQAGDRVVFLAERPAGVAPYRDSEGLTPPRIAANPDHMVGGFFVDVVAPTRSSPACASVGASSARGRALARTKRWTA